MGKLRLKIGERTEQFGTVLCCSLEKDKTGRMRDSNNEARNSQTVVGVLFIRIEVEG